MNKLISWFVILTYFYSLTAFAIGRIQNEDIRSLSDIESAVLSTTGNLTSGNACISSPGSTTGLATGQYIYDQTNPSYISAGTTIAGLPGTCSTGQIQMSSNANHNATGDTITFGGQPSQLINDSKIYVTGASLDSQLSSLLSSNSILNSGSTTAASLAANLSIGSNTLTSSFTNSTSGTTTSELVILNSSGQALTATTSSTSGVIGIAVSGAGTSGTVQVSQVGETSCVFDGATTAGDYVQSSISSAGECHDAGSVLPSNGNQVLGRVLSTNGSGGTYSIALSLGASSSSSASGSKNYLTAYTASTSGGIANTGNGNFEQGSTNGWSLGTVGTLTNGLPTGTPTFGSGASGNLSISTVSGGSQIAGNYSMSYTSSAATTQGNMVASSAFYIDSEDQAKVMTVKYYYTVASGASNDNFSGSSSNSFAWAAWDVTNSTWLSSAGNFCMVQSSGQGYCTGTFQTGYTTDQIRFVVYNANASSGATTLYFDDFFVGPQTAPFGPAMNDMVVNTGFSPGGAFGTTSGTLFTSRRVGNKMQVTGYTVVGTATSSTAQISIPVSIDYSVIGSGQQTAIGKFYVGTSSSTSAYQTQGVIFVDGSTTNEVFLGFHNSSGDFVKDAGNVALNNNEPVYMYFEFPVSGWSSNSSMSSDTDTRVVAMKAHTATASNMGTLGTSATVVKYDTVDNDTHGAYSTSSGIYTIPVTGYYDVAASVYTSGTFALNGYVQIQIYNNTTSSIIGINNTTAGGAITDSVPTSIAMKSLYFTAGTQLQINALYGGTYTSGAYATSTTANYFTVARQSGPAVIAATESVNARYYSSTSSISSSDGVIDYSTKDFDSHNAYNTSTGTYTIPVSGKFQINAKVRIAATYSINESIQISIYHNGSSASKQTIFAGGSQASLAGNISDIINCLAGDTIQIEANSNGSSPSIQNSTDQINFSIGRIGN